MAGRGRPRKQPALFIEQPKTEELDDMQLETLDDYRVYNNKARKLGLKVKVPPLHLHEHIRCKVTRLDGQERNAIRIRKRNSEIDYDDTVMPGTVVELPEMIVDFLQTLVYPQYKQVSHPDGTAETVWSHDLPRFAVSMVR